MNTSYNGFSDKQLIQYAPSVGAPHAHGSRSDQYGYVPTIDVVDALRDEGFVPTGVTQARTLDKSKREFTKHLIVLTHERDMAAYQHRTSQELFLQILLTNSHAGESSFRLDRGVYRLICSNGLIVGDIEQSIRIQHRRTVVTEVVNATLAIAQNSDRIYSRIAAMKRVRLNRDERLAFGRAALALRFPRVVEADPGSGAILPTPDQLLTPIRRGDTGDDLFTVFNVAQDKLVNGMHFYDERGRRQSTRAIRGIDGLTDLNKDLWLEAEKVVANHW